MNSTKLTRRKFLAMAAGGVAAALASDGMAKNPERRPNVLFIAVDDWNDWVGCFGGNQAKTPNLDRLAKCGTSFRYAHANATYCAPSRTSLMIGKQPHITGFYHDEPHFVKENSPQLVDLPAWFRKHGYYVAGGGKLYHHMPGFIDMRGWDEYFIWNPAMKKRGWGLHSWEAPAPLPARVPFSPVVQSMTGTEPVEVASADKRPKVDSHMEYGPLANEDEPKMADTICTKWAADFLGTKRDKPFFLGFGLYAPHKPNYAPQKYFDMYPLADIKAPKPHPGDLDDLPPQTQKHYLRRKKRVHDHVVKTKSRKKAVRGYLAALSYADAMIGRVLDALDAGPHANNTIVVLWSDNGYHLGEKFAWAKHTLWERTSNVPLVFAGPQVARGAIVDTTVSLLDVYPTLVDLTKLPTNKDTEGVSLAGVLRDPKSAKDRTIVQTNGPGEFSMINQSWRYIHHANDEEELYDLKNDPGEHHNLAGKEIAARTLADFRKQSPKEFARQGMGIHAGNLRPRFKGESFEWKPWSRPKNKRKKKSGPKQ